MKERRTTRRLDVDVLINKYVDGFPHACRALDISLGGILLRRIHEPKVKRDSYAIEIGLPEAKPPMWLWARQVWSRGRRQALRFVGMSTSDRDALEMLIASLPRAA